MIKVARTVTLVLLTLTGLNAVVAGFLFIVDPLGQKMGMTVDYLKFAPFETYLIPGIILFLVNGISNLLAAFCLYHQKSIALPWVIVQGILLCGWILVQVMMVHDLNPLHIIMFTIGVLMICFGALLKNQHAQAS